MDIQFINTSEWGIDKGKFKEVIRRLQKQVPKTEGVLNVVFVNDDYIHGLNKAYRKKDTPTDVLSFSYLDSPDFETTELIGEIYISIPTAERQAKEYEHSLPDELNRLFAHGFLHIFGHDHETDEDYERMKKIEDEVLED